MGFLTTFIVVFVGSWIRLPHGKPFLFVICRVGLSKDWGGSFRPLGAVSTGGLLGES